MVTEGYLSPTSTTSVLRRPFPGYAPEKGGVGTVEIVKGDPPKHVGVLYLRARHAQVVGERSFEGVDGRGGGRSGFKGEVLDVDPVAHVLPVSENEVSSTDAHPDTVVVEGEHEIAVHTAVSTVELGVMNINVGVEGRERGVSVVRLPVAVHKGLGEDYCSYAL